MSITFPTGWHNRHGRHAPLEPGRPERASHCRCEKPLTDQRTDLCARCGRYSKQVIQDTWQGRAQEVAAAARRSKRKAA